MNNKKNLTKLRERLYDCMEHDENVMIHIHFNDVVVKNAITPDDIMIDEDSISISKGNFEIDFPLEEFVISYEKDEYEEGESIQINAGAVKIYFDFI